MSKPYWEPRLETKDDILYQYLPVVKQSSLDNFRRNGLSNGIDLSVTGTGVQRGLGVTKRFYKHLLPNGIPRPFRPMIQEPKEGNPYTHEIDKLVVSCASIKYAYILTLLDEYIKNRSVIWEIGSGYGGQARALLMTGKVSKYILQDFDIHLQLSKYFLKREKYPREYIPVDTKPDTQVDWVINTHSFMEMPSDAVKRYFRFIHETIKPGGYFFHANFNKLTEPGATLKVQDYPMDADWKLVWEHHPPEVLTGAKLGMHYLYQRLA